MCHQAGVRHNNSNPVAIRETHSNKTTAQCPEVGLRPPLTTLTVAATVEISTKPRSSLRAAHLLTLDATNITNMTITPAVEQVEAEANILPRTKTVPEGPEDAWTNRATSKRPS